VFELVAIASAGEERGGGGATAAVDGRSGTVDGVKAGALRGISSPPLPLTPDGGTDVVAATGCAGTVSNIGPGAPFAVASAAGFAALSGLCADFSDLSDLAEGLADLSDLCADFSDFSDLAEDFVDLSDLAEDFVDLSDLCAGLADLSGLRADCACGAGFASATGAAWTSVARNPAAKNAIMRRMAVTGTGLSTAALPAAVSGVPSSACKIDELLMCSPLRESTNFTAKTGHVPRTPGDSTFASLTP
jgi:hypothetical protein